MQRWFLANSTEAGSESSQGQANGQTPIGNNVRLHTFRVLVNQHLEPGECVAVTGECSSLGCWLPAHCVQMNRENGECQLFIRNNKQKTIKRDEHIINYIRYDQKCNQHKILFHQETTVHRFPNGIN